MATMFTKESLRQMRGKPVLDRAGQKIGGIEDIYLDDRTDEPEWVGLGTGFFGSKHVVVPLQSAELREDGISVPYTKDKVKDAPDIGDTDHVSPEKESEIIQYYSLGRAEPQASMPAADTMAGQRKSEETPMMTRSEEELRVGKREVPAGQIHLRKWVETEPVSEDVELRQDTAHVERRPVDRPLAAGEELGEDTVSVPLSKEEPVVEKTARVKEEIDLQKEAETRSQTVTGEVGKERVEIEGDDTDIDRHA